MAPLPKKKISTSRKKRRRAHIDIKVPQLLACPQCRSPRVQHRACPTCGTYRGREVLALARERKPKIPDA